MNIKIIKQSDILRCPKVILLPEHYREDGSCRCDEWGCEWERGCINPKWFGEIYCRQHLIEMGEDFDS